MDASIVGTLVGARNRLATRSLALHIRSPSAAAERLFAVCGRTGREQGAAKLRLHASGDAPALGTWVDVPAQPNEAHVADFREPAMADWERGAS
jgi:hypothetical protein